MLAQWLCGRFWTRSRASGAGRGLFPTTHVAAIKRRKGPCSRGPLLLPVLSKIPPSRCYSNWTHFQHLKERREGGILQAAPLHPLFKWWIMRLNIFLSGHFSAWLYTVECILCLWGSFFSHELSKFNFYWNKHQWVLCNSFGFQSLTARCKTSQHNNSAAGEKKNLSKHFTDQVKTSAGI